jgi:HD-GYP domain-containing protein (c-di-GMP phosphodiesterase class II)
MRLNHSRSKAVRPSDVLERLSILLSELRTAQPPEQLVASAMDLLGYAVPADAVLLLDFTAHPEKASVLHASGAWSSISSDSIACSRSPGDEEFSVRLHGTSLQSALERRAQSMELWNAPLRSHSRALGSLWLARASASPPTFSAREQQTASMVADIIAGGLMQSGLDDRTGMQQNQILAMRSVERAISSSMDLKVTLNVLLDSAVEQLGADAASILLLDEKQRDLTIAAVRGFQRINHPASRLRAEHSLATQASLERHTVFLTGSRPGDPALEHQPLMREEGFSTYLASPMIAHGNVKGVLEVFRRSPGVPDPEWMDRLEFLSLQGAIAIESTESFLNLQRTHSELSRACDSTIEGWSRAVDLRARDAEGHSQRVAELTIRLAERMGFPPNDLPSLRRGALLHDIGKIGIPDRILWKPDALSEEEWQLMRQHPKMAEQLLSPIEFLRSALDIPKFHHERWDGKGYPYGLSGSDIPLAARAFAVIDVWDSMQAPRPFRDRPFSESESIQYLHQESGRQFDPAAVSSFLQILHEPGT